MGELCEHEKVRKQLFLSPQTFIRKFQTVGPEFIQFCINMRPTG